MTSVFATQTVMLGAARSITLAPPAPPGSAIIEPALNSNWKLVASWKAPDPANPIPIDARLTVSNAQPTIFAPDIEGSPQYSIFPGFGAEGETGLRIGGAINLVTQPTVAAAWRITYGAGGEKRTMICDLRSGRYVLGACTYCDIEALRWGSNAWSDTGPTLTISGAVVPSSGGAMDEPTVTQVYKQADAAAIDPMTIVVPTHARWWAPVVDAGEAGGTPFWGSDNPDLTITGLGENVVLSPSENRVTPLKHRYEVLVPSINRADQIESTFPPFAGQISAYTEPSTSTLEYYIGIRFWLAT